MSNLNLATKKNHQSKLQNIGKGLIITVLGLILVICLYLVLLFMNKKVSAQIEAVHSQYKSEYSKFLANNASKVLDFKKRSDLAQKLIAKNKSMSDIFNQIEKDMLPQVYLISYDYNITKSKVVLECSGDNFSAVAKQASSFKKSNFFKEVSLGKSMLNVNNNRVNFIINLKIK